MILYQPHWVIGGTISVFQCKVSALSAEYNNMPSFAIRVIALVRRIPHCQLEYARNLIAIVIGVSPVAAALLNHVTL